MKKLVVIGLVTLFLLGCEYYNDRVHTEPTMEVFECHFTNSKPKKYLKITFDCLELKQKDANFTCSSVAGSYSSTDREDNSIVVPKKVLDKEVRGFFHINLFPYNNPTGADDPDCKEGTKITYVMRIYKDEEVVYKKVLKYPQKEYRNYIKINL